MKNSDFETKKENILKTTIELLKIKSIDLISIREIASLAKVNTASINYYFKSKDLLFENAIEYSMTTGINQWFFLNIDFCNIKKSDLSSFVLFLHLSTIQNPSLSRTRIINLLNAKSTNNLNIKIFEMIYKIAKSIYIGTDTDELKIKVSLVYASLVNISCTIDDLNIFLNTQIENEEVLKKYINSIIDIIFN